MSDIIKVEYEEVNQLASEMVEDTQHMKEVVLRLKNAVDSTAGVWEGDAANGMRQYFDNRVQPLIEQMSDLILDRIESLRMATGTLMDTDESLSRMF
jgi:WXG100 family type VII secretion target